MSKPLVIVESPAKAKTIAKFLGDGFDVRASVGHIADLPSKGLSVDVDNGFKPTYELTERGSTIIKELKSVLKTASALYLATDEDREGEAIAAHLFEYLKPKNIETKRMVFHEITKAAIDAAIANPRDIDYKLVDAAEARRILTCGRILLRAAAAASASARIPVCRFFPHRRAAPRQVPAARPFLNCFSVRKISRACQV